MTLVIPNFRGQATGSVAIPVTLTNYFDQAMVERNRLAATEIRSCTVDRLWVDTKFLTLGLPAAIIERLGLVYEGTSSGRTSEGILRGRLFGGVEFRLADRQGTFDCLELTEQDTVLLGRVPMEVLGLQPELDQGKLRLLPMNAKQTYLSLL